MAESESDSGIVMTLVNGVIEVIGIIAKALWGFVAKFVPFLLWVLAAIIILPCVFVAGEIYPKWQEWGEDF